MKSIVYLRRTDTFMILSLFQEYDISRPVFKYKFVSFMIVFQFSLVYYHLSLHLGILVKFGY